MQPRDPRDLVQKVTQTGLAKTQLVLNPLRDNPDTWSTVHDVLAANGVQIVSGMFATIREDYTSLESIRATGGIVPDQHWDGNLQLARDIARIAQQLGLCDVSTHAGFIPHDPCDPSLPKLQTRIQQIAALFADHGLTLLLETGQETADDLLDFLGCLDSPNVTVNFDPANMILYDKGDPIDALQKLLPHVRQVHLKDAIYTSTPGAWGTEVPVGQGQVDWPAFIQLLSENDFRGHLVIEREAGDDRVGDTRQAIDHINQVMDRTTTTEKPHG